MIKIAFASTDKTHVDLHFGASERMVIYEVSPGQAELLAVGEFRPAMMKGENRFKGLKGMSASKVFVRIVEGVKATAEELSRPPEDKVVAKLNFVQECAAVYAASIGTSSIKRLVAAGIQPIIVENGHTIVDLLTEVSHALTRGGVTWVDKAVARSQEAKSQDNALSEGETP